MKKERSTLKLRLGAVASPVPDIGPDIGPAQDPDVSELPVRESVQQTNGPSGRVPAAEALQTSGDAASQDTAQGPRRGNKIFRMCRHGANSLPLFLGEKRL